MFSVCPTATKLSDGAVPWPPQENAALKAEAAATSVADGVARTIGVGGGDRERRGSMQ